MDRPWQHCGRALLLALPWLSLAGAAPVYRCHGDGQPPVFSQYPCETASGEGARIHTVQPAQTVQIPALSAAELARLQRLEQRRAALLSERARARAKAARLAQQQRQERAERCREAKAAQAALARQRRKGYGLDQARELDRQEAALDAELRESCRG